MTAPEDPLAVEAAECAIRLLSVLDALSAPSPDNCGALARCGTEGGKP